MDKKPKPYSEPKIKVPRFSEAEGFYTTPQRSFNMSQIKGKNTQPEKLLRKALWHAGVRYRSNKQKLPGKPDISLIKYKLVIFVDGSFWHGHDWEKRNHQIQPGLLDSQNRKEQAARPRDQSILSVKRLDRTAVLGF
ncbi:very short patch repair endonuclease [Cecembia calidifontis]|uniref:DNA mismatch endonuclease Vsr n=1 Tax=Cecembia calidifontis TaxID=1187080 RepID=A0A4Q7P8Z6_9BACT|nr:very short patch repair endonuclease [Cecembia calidifontis]RZS95212.1 DNA mismatch endonuclease Vsr [Cecembia calidifontis]